MSYKTKALRTSLQASLSVISNKFTPYASSSTTIAYAICELCTLDQIASFTLIEDPTLGAKLVCGILAAMAIIIAVLMLKTAYYKTQKRPNGASAVSGHQTKT